MANPTRALTVKNASGVVENLAVGVDDEGLVPFHAIYGTAQITSSQLNPVAIVGTVSIDSIPSTAVQVVTSSHENPVTVVNTYATIIDDEYLNSDWNIDLGTFKIASLDYERKEVMICNRGPGILYIKMSHSEQNGSSYHGFNIEDTSSPPSNYSFMIHPSGTYVSSDASRVFYYGGFYADNGTLPGGVQITRIK